MKDFSFFYLIKKLSKFREGIILSMLLFLIWTVLEISLPFITKLLIDEGIIFADKNLILILVTAIVLFNIGILIADFSKAWIVRNIGVRLNMDIIQEYYKRLISKEYIYFDSINKGRIIQNVNDNLRIETFLTQGVLTLFNSTFKLFIYSFVLFFFDSLISIIFILSISVLIFWQLVFLRWRSQIDEEKFKLTTSVHNEVIQTAQGILDIKVNNIEWYQYKLWSNLQQLTANVRLNLLRLVQTYRTVIFVISQVRNGIIISIISFLILKGDMTIGTLMAVLYILGQTSVPLSDLLNLTENYQDAKLSFSRFSDIYNSSSTLELKQRKDSKSNIEFDGVTFIYPNGNKGVFDISFNIPFGSRILIAGESGNGKSTILKLITGLYSPYKGVIKFCAGNEIFEPETCSVGFLSQDSIIFNDTLLFNITLSNQLTYDQQRFRDILESTCLKKVFECESNPEKIYLGKEGITLSKGQQQRVLLARAIYTNASILVLDEPTSGLDIKMSIKIIDQLFNHCIDKTIIIASHKEFIKKKVDDILLLKNGKIIS